MQAHRVRRWGQAAFFDKYRHSGRPLRGASLGPSIPLSTKRFSQRCRGFASLSRGAAGEFVAGFGDGFGGVHGEAGGGGDEASAR